MSWLVTAVTKSTNSFAKMTFNSKMTFIFTLSVKITIKKGLKNQNKLYSNQSISYTMNSRSLGC